MMISNVNPFETMGSVSKVNNPFETMGEAAKVQPPIEAMGNPALQGTTPAGCGSSLNIAG